MKNLNENELLLQFMKVCPIPNYYFEKGDLRDCKTVQKIFKKRK